MKRIYLDQNQWISLLKGLESKDEEVLDLIQQLKEKISKEEIILPISIIHVLETMKITNTEKRNKLWDFILSFSKNNTMCAFRNFLTEFEAQNLFLRKLNFPEIDIKKIIFRRGVSGLFGTQPSINHDGSFPKELEKEILLKVDSFDTLKNMLNTPSHVKSAQATAKKSESDAIKLSSVRDNERIKFKDKELGNKVIRLRYFSQEVFPLLAKIGVKYSLPPISLLREGASKQEAEALLQSFPSTYTYVCLTDRRDRMRERNVHPHDLNDIFSLSTAIPYCDVVVGEKMFLGLAKQEKLDKIYGTKLITSLKELKKIIS